MYGALSGKIDRVLGRALDYVLHCERNILINQSSSLRVRTENLYFTTEYTANKLSCAEELLGKTCTLMIISVLLTYADNPFGVLPIYHYLSSLASQLDSIINICVRCTRYIKDYYLLEPMLNEYQPRLEAKQFHMNNSIHIETLHFTYKQSKIKRKEFTLELSQSVNFHMGETILITGNSGAGKVLSTQQNNSTDFFEGKSTFYDIISGCISKEEYSAKVRIDDSVQLPDLFHNLEASGTIVLQDTQMDFKCSIYTTISDIEDDDDDEQLTRSKQEEEERVWRFQRLVEIDTFVEETLQGQIHVLVENRPSGGQKSRLMLARALSRAEQRQSVILILDEPDRGLPSETTFRIMLNIIQWFRTRGILFLTLHNDRVRERLPLHHILHIEHGCIRSLQTTNSKYDTSP